MNIWFLFLICWLFDVLYTLIHNVFVEYNSPWKYYVKYLYIQMRSGLRTEHTNANGKRFIGRMKIDSHRLIEHWTFANINFRKMSSPHWPSCPQYNMDELFNLHFLKIVTITSGTWSIQTLQTLKNVVAENAKLHKAFVCYLCLAIGVFFLFCLTPSPVYVRIESMLW